MLDLEKAKEQIKARVDLTSFCNQYLERDPKHRKNKYKCCFCDSGNGTHGTGDLTIYNDRFYCFACGKHGDVINLYQHLHNYDFIQAVKELARENNINIEDNKKNYQPSNQKPQLKTQPKPQANTYTREPRNNSTDLIESYKELKELKERRTKRLEQENNQQLNKEQREKPHAIESKASASIYTKEQERKQRLILLENGTYKGEVWDEITEPQEFYFFGEEEENERARGLLDKLNTSKLKIITTMEDLFCLYVICKPYLIDYFDFEKLEEQQRLITTLERLVNELYQPKREG